jgi:hypothetical protein
VKFRRPLVESNTRPETEELLTTCICNPTIVAVVTLVRTVDMVVVESTVLLSVVILCDVVTDPFEVAVVLDVVAGTVVV